MKQFRVLVGVALLVLLLASCQQGEPPVEAARRVNGTAQNWPGGAATIQPVITDETGTNVDAELDVTGTVSEDGSFSLTLPATVEAGLLTTTPICEGTFDGTVTPASWGEFFAEMAVMQGEEFLGGMILASSADTLFSPEVGEMMVFRLYVDQDVSVNGTCTEDGVVTEFDADAEEGWNFVAFEALEVGPMGFPTRVRITTPETIPAGVEWYFMSAAEPLSMPR